MGFTPRPARVRVRLNGAVAYELRLENEQARLLVRTLRTYAEVLENEQGSVRDEDIVDGLLSMLWQELSQHQQAGG